jgi:3',5'-cyclic AMP phosphodiesterase CpdA
VLTVLHISDLHFGPHFVPRVGDALLRLAPSLEPDVIVVSGDLTQRATPEQFAQARDYLRQLPDVPRICVPGNHDVPLYRIAERLFDPHRYYRQYIAEELDQCYRNDRAVFVALDSTAPRQSISNGRLHPGQLEFCAEEFGRTPPDAARILVAHHHFAPAPDYERDWTMPGAKRALNCFVDLGVDLILGGHLHRAYIGNSLDVYPGSHRERGIIIVQCGTTTSRRGRGREKEKNTFNLLRVGQEMLRITHYMFFDPLGEFAPASRHIFPRPGGRFVEDHVAGTPERVRPHH